MLGSVGLRLFTLLLDSSNFVSWVGRHWLIYDVMSKHDNSVLLLFWTRLYRSYYIFLLLNLSRYTFTLD